MNAIKVKNPHLYTFAEYENLEGNWELIEGIPYAMEPQPSMYHQKINVGIVSHIKNALEGCNNCEVYIPINWKLNNVTVFQPDAIVVCKPYEEGNYLTKTPEIVFEILSPSTADKDKHLKYELYEAAGVKYYIIVNPMSKKAEVFTLKNNEYHSEGEFTTNSIHFVITGCEFDFEFKAIW